jgi:Uma2 family endonuclease
MTDVVDRTTAGVPTETSAAEPAVALEADPSVPFPLVLRMPPTLPLDDEQFLALCSRNEPLRFERTADGDIVIMPPAGEDAPIQNSELNYQLAHWAKQDGTGRAFDSSAGFTLPSTAIRGPDAAWVRRERLAALTPEQKKPFPQIYPDFVVELRSSTDRLSDLRKKMQEYMKNGVRLGWLIDPTNRHVYVYRPGVPAERLDNPATVAGDPVLPSFVLDAQAVFDAGY